MAVIKARVWHLGLSILSNGVRRLSLGMGPAGLAGIIEVLAEDETRNRLTPGRQFMADETSAETAKLLERLKSQGQGANVIPLLATLDDGAAPIEPTDEWGLFSSPFPAPMIVSPRTIDEILNQDRSGRKIAVAAVDIENLIEAPSERTEGSLVGWLWEQKKVSGKDGAPYP